MRRGLMSWSKEEVPVEVLDARVAHLQAAMDRENLSAVLVYTSFAQPAAVHWLSNFTPYWSEALLLVLPQGAPVLLAALTQRVHGWIREIAHLGDVVAAPALGASALKLLAENAVEVDARIGVVGLDVLPWSIACALFKERNAECFVDASKLYLDVRQPGDRAERALLVRASTMAADALGGASQAVSTTAELAAQLETSARGAGAEEVLHRVAANLERDSALLRLEGDTPLGASYAVELSVAYKGAWIRLGRSVSQGEAPPFWCAAEKWFSSALESLRAGAPVHLPQCPGKLTQWTLEASIGLQPLSAIAAQGLETVAALPAGSVAVFSAHLEFEGASWFRCEPLVIEKQGSTVLEN